LGLLESHVRDWLLAGSHNSAHCAEDFEVALSVMGRDGDAEPWGAPFRFPLICIPFQVWKVAQIISARFALLADQILGQSSPYCFTSLKARKPALAEHLNYNK
jgi:hypothetical protein